MDTAAILRFISLPFRTLIFVLSLSFLSSCDSDRLDVDVSDVKAPAFKIGRFEQDLFSSLSEEQLSRNYGAFFYAFRDNILCPTAPDSVSCSEEIKRFRNYPGFRGALAQISQKYPDIDFLKNGLTDIYRHYKYYFPQAQIPIVHTAFTGFNYNMLRLDKAFGIGMEMYLGKTSTYYDSASFPQYKRRLAEKEYMLPDFTKAFVTTEFRLTTEPTEAFLNHIINEGKILYLTEALMPEAHDSVIIGFSQKHLDWCRENEGNMWSFFVKNDIIFSTDTKVINRYMAEGPFTKDFKNSPARVGAWIGWQIVRKYMDKNTNVSLAELVNTRDPQVIFSKAGYKPKI